MNSLKSLTPLLVLVVISALISGDAMAAPPAATFTPLSGIPGSADMMLTYHMSYSGDAIVGEEPPTDGAHGEGVVAMRSPGSVWTVTKVGVFPTSDPHYSPAFGVSTAGHVAVGLGSSGDPALDVPYRWSPPGPQVALALFPGDKLASARAVSSNGKTIVGWGRTERTDRWRASDPFSHAIVWDAPSFAPTLLDAIPGSPVETQAMAIAVSRFMIAGFAVSDRSESYPYDPTTESRGHEAIVWVQGGGGVYQRHWLGFLPSSKPPSRAYDISEEGERVIGFSGPFGISRPVLWTREHNPFRYVIRDLGVLPGYQAGGASAISANARVVVGACYRGSGDTFESEAFIWDDTHGMRMLRDVLQAAGATNVAGWNLADATGVSRDGEWISGHGTAPDGTFTAWVARLP